MKILAYELGRIVQFVNIDEILPLKGAHLPDLLPLITQRYSFTYSPSLNDSIEKLRENGLKFTDGKIQNSQGEEHIIKDFTVFPDGLLISALKTDIAYSFKDDLFSWGQQEFGLRPDLISTDLRGFISEIVVQFDSSIDQLIHKMEVVSEFLGTKLKGSYGNEFPQITVASVKFDYDKSIAPASFFNLTSFTIERRANHRFIDNSFYCQAPVSTQDHIEALEMIESLLR